MGNNMKRKLTKEEVLHVANLARIEVKDEEIKKYAYQLKQILNEIDRINKVKITNEDIMISPTSNVNIYNDDEIRDVLEIKQVIANAPKANGNYIEVPMVLNE
jgi:aspartyl-tRNA(Asn)/glutamyl-tRNA(Gln) amidotransferase subunit C